MSTRRISHFEVRRVLGEGAMGQVFLARDVNLDRPVALKLLGDRTIGDPAFLDRFKREARLAAQLNHPNIATIYAFGEEKGEAYIAMEFVEGVTLNDMISQQGPLPVPDVKKYGRQAASALAVAHDRGIVHRDIKSANLMITADGDLKVLDFGVARRSGETQLTMAGSLVGTANIMAPELIKGGEATASADLFSLGCVLYEALAGHPAFEGEDPMAILYKVMHDEPRGLQEMRPDIPPGVLSVIDGLLVKDPGQRFGPARAVAEALSDEGTASATPAVDPGAVGTMVLSTPEGEDALVPEAPKPEGSSRKRIGLLAGAAVVVAAVVVYFATRGGVELDPELARSLNSQAIALINDFGGDEDSVKKALGLLDQASDADPHSAPIWNNLGVAHWRLENQRVAKGYFERAISEDSTYARAHAGMGLCWEWEKEYDLAKNAYRKAIGLDSTLVEPVNDLAYMFLYDLAQPESVLAEPVLRRFPEEAAILDKLGRAYLQTGDIDSAETMVTRALALDPTRSSVLQLRADIEAARAESQ